MVSGLLIGPGSPHVFAQAPAQQGQLDASRSLFAVLAALNAAGYDEGLDSPTNHPLRLAVRKAIAARKPPSLVRLKNFFEARSKWDASSTLSQYISFALSVEGPPDFKPRFGPNRMPPDVVSLEGLSPILADFSREAGLDELWQQSQPAIDQAIAEYHGPVSEAILQANMFLRNPTSGMSGRRFQIYLDLLGAPNQVHSRSLGDEYFVVVTPSTRPRIREIRHAYLHYLLDPLAIRYSAQLEPKKGLGDFAQASPVLEEAYKNDFVLLTGMCLVKAIEARLDRELGPAYVEQSMREGFVLTAYFFEALQRYEKQDLSLRLYLPDIFDAIDLRKEDQRIAQITFASEKAVRRVKPVQPPAPAKSEAESAVEAAEDLYSRRELPAAKEAYRKVLKITATPQIHAKAYYGLARVATLEGNPEVAQQLFEKTLEMQPDAFERAWTHVYLARLAIAASDPLAAAKQYQAALAVEGASEGARKAAQQELARVTAPRQN